MAYNTVRDKRSYLPQLKIVIHTDTNYEISKHVNKERGEIKSTHS
jgi:hypothetical protein